MALLLACLSTKEPFFISEVRINLSANRFHESSTTENLGHVVALTRLVSLSLKKRKAKRKGQASFHSAETEQSLAYKDKLIYDYRYNKYVCLE